MRCYVFLDLDDTLFQTRPKCPPGVELHPAAYRVDNVALSFMTPQQHHFLSLLSTTTTIIPTTARNLAAFRRVRLSFTSFVLLDFGGVILLNNGSLDSVWDARIRPLALAMARELETWRRRLTAFVEKHDLGCSVRLISDVDMPLYVVVKHPHGDVSMLDRVRTEALMDIDSEQFFIHVNDNNLSVVPRFLGKEHAVRHLLDHHLRDEPKLTIGVGDSDTDAPFLALCDFAMFPRHSQLAERL